MDPPSEQVAWNSVYAAFESPQQIAAKTDSGEPSWMERWIEEYLSSGEGVVSTAIGAFQTATIKFTDLFGNEGSGSVRCPPPHAEKESVHTSVALERVDSAAGASDNLPQNRWNVSKVSQSTDTLCLDAVRKVSLDEFRKANPRAQGQSGKLPDDGEYRLWHASTGEIDGGWKIVRYNSERQQYTMAKTYSLEVQHLADHSGLIEALPGISEEMRKPIERKLAQLPPNVVSALEKAGYKIVIAPFIPDVLPGLKQLTPRGWAPELTFYNSDGTQDNVSRRIIAPQRVQDSEGRIGLPREEVLVHQIGHALDFANGFLSGSEEFVAAYNKEIAGLPKNHPIVKYFSQSNGAGRQEVFATLFGLALTGPENPEDKAWLERSFPETLQVVRRQIRAL